MELGKNIAKYRNQFDMTQEDLAEKCDVSRQAVAKWEAGQSEPGIEKLCVMADLFEVSIDNLLGREEDSGKEDKFCIDKTDLLVPGLISAHLVDNIVMANIGLSRKRAGFDFQGDAFYLSDRMARFIYYAYSNNRVGINEKYLLRNTKKRERLELVERMPFYYDFDEYINGKKELLECISTYIKKTERKGDFYQEKVGTIVRIFSKEQILENTDIERNIISFYDDVDGKASDFPEDNVIFCHVPDIEYDELEDYGIAYEDFFAEAPEVAEFVMDCIENEEEIICQCAYGQGRSVGCAAAIFEFVRMAGAEVLSDYRYYSNKMVYQKLLEELRKKECELFGVDYEKMTKDIFFKD